MNIFIERVRGFVKAQSIPVRPLTQLVGENSSGKSTFLAIGSSILSPRRFPGSLGFGEPPYPLGSFDTVGTAIKWKSHREQSFTIGFSEGEKGAEDYREVFATYGSDSGSIVLRRFRALSSAGALDLEVARTAVEGKLTLLTRGSGRTDRVLRRIAGGLLSRNYSAPEGRLW